MNTYTFLKQENVTTTIGEVLSFNTVPEIAKFIINHNYSGGHYLTGRRSDRMLAQTNIIIIDIDDIQPNQKSMYDVQQLLKSYKHIIAPTKSHQIIKNGKTLDRYRIILFVDRPITSSIKYKEAVAWVCSLFDLKADTKCFNVSHFYYRSKSVYSLNESGKEVDIQSLYQDNSLSKTFINHTKLKNKFNYVESNLDIPSVLSNWINSYNSRPVFKKKEKFIRILIAQKDLVRSDNLSGQQIGLGRNFIPQEYLCKEINIDRKTISRWIKDLIKLGQLEVVSKEYGKNYKGKEYRARNELEQAVIQSFLINCNTPKTELPTHINDGEWESTLIKVVWRFCNDETSDRYLNWAKSLPTISSKPERINKVKRAWISMKKKLEELNN